MLASDLTYTGIALEATKGLAVAPTAWPPLTTFTPQDVLEFAADTGNRGSMVDVYANTPTKQHAEVDMAGSIYADTFGFLLASILADVTTTGASAPYSHAMSTRNAGDGQAKGLSVLNYNAADLRYYAGLTLSDLEIAFSADGLLTHTAKGLSYASVVAGAADRNGTVTPTPPARSYSTVPQAGAWRGVWNLGGSATGRISDGKISFKRPVTDRYSMANSQAPYQLFAGKVGVTGSLNIYAEAARVEQLQYLTAAATPLTASWSQGAGAAVNGLAVQMSQVRFTKLAVNQNSAEYVMIAVDFTGEANTTDVGASGGYSPAKATVQCAAPTGTFQ